jgi:small subunit ribosomal protein S13
MILKKNNNFILKSIKKKQKIKKYIYELISKYGIGVSSGTYICNIFGIPPYINKNNVSKQLQQFIENWIKLNLKTGRALNLEITQNINSLIKNKSRRGLRHLWGLPVRGQRSKTNGRTQKSRKRKF